MRQGFTLIELLIVVAIIGILAAIAVPNFLNAQIKAKVSRVYSDMRALSNAIEMYSLDNGNKVPYPILPAGNSDWYMRQVRMTTPIAYISSLPVDPFYINLSPNAGDHDRKGVFDYVGREYAGPQWGFAVGSLAQNARYFIRSPGPDSRGTPIPWTSHSVYDLTNGLKSFGDIFYIDFHPAR